jgi:hypothetical protein
MILGLGMEESGVVTSDAGSAWTNWHKLAVGRPISISARMAVRNSGL